MTDKEFGKQRPPPWVPPRDPALSAEANLRYRRCSRLALLAAEADPEKARAAQDQIQQDLDWLYAHVRLSGSTRTTTVATTDAFRASQKADRQQKAATSRKPKTHHPKWNGEPLLPSAQPSGYTQVFVADLMDMLTPRHKAAIALVFLGGLTHAEAARELRCTHQAISKALASARNFLHHHLTEKS